MNVFKVCLSDWFRFRGRHYNQTVFRVERFWIIFFRIVNGFIFRQVFTWSTAQRSIAPYAISAARRIDSSLSLLAEGFQIAAAF